MIARRPSARPGRALAPLLGVLMLAWSVLVWAVAESPWWAPVLVGLFNLAILAIGHWNDRKRRRLVKKAAKLQRERDDVVKYLIEKGVIDKPPPESGFVEPKR